MRHERRSVEYRLWAKVRKTDTCWLWTGSVTRLGYGKIGVGGKHGGWIGAHRAAWIICRGSIPAGQWVLHHCDNPGCVRPDHLFLGTHADNMADMTRKGRSTRGPRNGMAKLTERAVLDIRRRREQGETPASIGRAVGITHQAVSKIVLRQRWAHV